MAMLAKASPHTSLPWHSLDDTAKAFLQVGACLEALRMHV